MGSGPAIGVFSGCLVQGVDYSQEGDAYLKQQRDQQRPSRDLVHGQLQRGIELQQLNVGNAVFVLCVPGLGPQVSQTCIALSPG